MDYNAYRRNEPNRLLKWTNHNGNVGRYQLIEEFFKATGLEEHGILADYDIFVNTGPPEKGRTCEPGDYDLRLKKNVNVVDAGIALPQITDGFVGKAPDLGCYELGQDKYLQSASLYRPQDRHLVQALSAGLLRICEPNTLNREAGFASISNDGRVLEVETK